MSGTPLRVVIVGGGLAGPCLALGLRRAGVDVTLHERDTGPASRTQGYRIHISPEGTGALRDCLDPDLYDLVTATSGVPGGGVTILGPGLETLRRITFDGPEASEHLSVDRVTLRAIMLTALGDRVRYGAAFTAYDELPNGRVRVRFDDDSSVEADLLVAADGTGSRVRRRLLPDAVVADTGLWTVFGKTPLTTRSLAATPSAALDGFSTVVAPDGRFMPLAGLRFREDPRRAAAKLLPGMVATDTRDYVMWVLGIHEAALRGTDLAALDGTGLRAFTADRVADWHPDVAELVRLGEPETIGAAPVRSAEPVDRWRTGPVTLIGDAIHSMVPSGTGAGVALRDAGLLAGHLTRVARGEDTLRRAVADYEAEMLDYGFAAVAAAANAGRTSNPVSAIRPEAADVAAQPVDG
jgi:2-polyprenyl-6-methoxyphenol hydroxylase-like FAD-dependent oxidoreductase